MPCGKVARHGAQGVILAHELRLHIHKAVDEDSGQVEPHIGGHFFGLEVRLGVGLAANPLHKLGYQLLAVATPVGAPQGHQHYGQAQYAQVPIHKVTLLPTHAERDIHKIGNHYPQRYESGTVPISLTRGRVKEVELARELALQLGYLLIVLGYALAETPLSAVADVAAHLVVLQLGQQCLVGHLQCLVAMLYSGKYALLLIEQIACYGILDGGVGGVEVHCHLGCRRGGDALLLVAHSNLGDDKRGYVELWVFHVGIGEVAIAVVAEACSPRVAGYEEFLLFTVAANHHGVITLRLLLDFFGRWLSHEALAGIKRVADA